jgi:hypothetical protein
MKPFALPKAFQSLTDEQLNTLNQWLDDPACTYQIIRAKLRELYNLQVSDPTLSRYSRRRVLADQTIDHDDSAHNIRTFLAIQNGEPIPYDQAGLALIQKRAFDAACAPHVPVAKLASLQRIFHYNTARADAEHRHTQSNLRLQQIVRRNDLAERSLNLREQEIAARAEAHSKLNTKNSELAKQSDALGPVATNWEEVGQRVCKIFNISPEEAKRRAELHKTWKDPHARPGIPEEINPVD